MATDGKSLLHYTKYRNLLCVSWVGWVCVVQKVRMKQLIFCKFWRIFDFVNLKFIHSAAHLSAPTPPQKNESFSGKIIRVYKSPHDVISSINKVIKADHIFHGLHNKTHPLNRWLQITRRNRKKKGHNLYSLANHNAVPRVKTQTLQHIFPL